MGRIVSPRSHPRSVMSWSKTRGWFRCAIVHAPGPPVRGPWKRTSEAGDGWECYVPRCRRGRGRGRIRRARERAAARRALQRAQRLWSAQGQRRADDGTLVGGPLALSLEWDVGTWDYRMWRIAKCGADRAVRRSPPVYYLPRWRAR